MILIKLKRAYTRAVVIYPSPNLGAIASIKRLCSKRLIKYVNFRVVFSPVS